MLSLEVQLWKKQGDLEHRGEIGYVAIIRENLTGSISTLVALKGREGRHPAPEIKVPLHPSASCYAESLSVPTNQLARQWQPWNKGRLYLFNSYVLCISPRLGTQSGLHHSPLFTTTLWGGLGWEGVTGQWTSMTQVGFEAWSPRSEPATLNQRTTLLLFIAWAEQIVLSAQKKER